MDESLISKKAFLIIFIILVFVAVVGAGISKLNENSRPTPSPTIEDLNLGQSSQQDQLRAQTTPAQISKQFDHYPFTQEQLKNQVPSQLLNKKGIIQTQKGNIEFEIYPEATKSAANFIFLSSQKYFDGLTFHRVEPNFVIQGGDPTGTGRGGPGYEFGDDPVTRPYKKGTVAMANHGPNTNGSQFFIVLADNPPLEPLYSIFGQVTKGLDVIEKIQKGDIIEKVTVVPIK